MNWLLAAAVLIGAFMIVATALPLLRKGAWWIRMFDFPRLQITAISAVTLAILLARQTARAHGRTSSPPCSHSPWPTRRT